MKRLMDIFLSALIMLLFAPVGIILALILKFTGEGEVFYYQTRMGKGGVKFYLIKFATMLKNSPNIGAKDITIKNDNRILPFGNFLRKTKLNEFPQFLNVLKGDMSLVGPRPVVENQYNMYSDRFKKAAKCVAPGITGIGSIIFRDEEKYFTADTAASNEIYKNKIIPFKEELEIWYANNRSLSVDLLILLNTFVVIFIPNSKLHNSIFKDLPKNELFK